MYLVLTAFFAVLLHCSGIQFTPEPQKWGLEFVYHDYNEMSRFLMQVVHYFPELASVYSIGKSVKGRELLVLKLSAPSSAILGTPHIKFVGNIHGNEPVGRELILHFIEYLVLHYPKDLDVQRLLNSTVIHFLPSLNPDGFERSQEGDCSSATGRENEKLIDLNRSFPDFFHANTVPIQPETEAVIKWLTRTHFVLSASLHGGALVANYPFESSPEADFHIKFFDNWIKTNESSIMDVIEKASKLTPDGSDQRDRLRPKYSAAPDDDVFLHLASAYANSHSTMHKGLPCKGDVSTFPGGITNGAAWYVLTGGMQDYNYVWHGCLELTLEVSCCKYPKATSLKRLWDENKKALLEYAKLTHMGVKGLVMSTVTGNGISGAVLKISGRNVNFTSSSAGEFWRILLPGEYTLEATANGYQQQKIPFTVKSRLERPEPTWLNVYLRPVQHQQFVHSTSHPKSGASNDFNFSHFRYLLITCLASRLVMIR